jgi:hypothetical protein
MKYEITRGMTLSGNYDFNSENENEYLTNKTQNCQFNKLLHAEPTAELAVMMFLLNNYFIGISNPIR